jgi:hypothetical protein
VDGLAGDAVLVGFGSGKNRVKQGNTFFTMHTTKSFSWILYDSTVWSSARILPSVRTHLISVGSTGVNQFLSINIMALSLLNLFLDLLDLRHIISKKIAVSA